MRRTSIVGERWPIFWAGCASITAGVLLHLPMLAMAHQLGQGSGARLHEEDARAPRLARSDHTDGLRSYRAAVSDLGNAEKQEVGRWANNRVENSHLPFRRAAPAREEFALD